MTVNKSLKISRRDAIKVLAAAGAITVAGLPDKWSKPVVQFGAIPVHAQTSRIPPIAHTIAACGAPVDVIEPNEDGQVIDPSSVTITPADSNISMTYSIVTTTGNVTTPASPTGTALTVNGVATVNFVVSNADLFNGTITVTWSFTNPSDGSGNCDQVFSWASTQ